MEFNTAPVLSRTEEEWHELFLRLDAEYGTDKRSPLHHDNRCTYCRPSSDVCPIHGEGCEAWV